MRLDSCPSCHGKLKIKKLVCESCDLGLEGGFLTSPLLNLNSSHQEFIEQFVLSSGSLKEMAQKLGISYPTVRARLDEIISALSQELKKRGDRKKEILDKVNAKSITPEEAARIIENL